MNSSKSIRIRTPSNFVSDNLNDDTREIIRILGLKIRKEKEIDKLMPLLEHVRFFQDRRMRVDDLVYVCK
jgi:hypothetical protein